MVWSNFANADTSAQEGFALEADAHTYPPPWIMGDVWVEDAVAKDEADDVQYDRGEDAGGVSWRRAETGEKGEIVICLPYPYLTRTIWGRC